MDTEKIIKIEFTDFIAKGKNCSGVWVLTSHQIIKIGVGSDIDCCESIGYIISDDNINDVIGAELIGVNITNTNKTKKSFDTDHFEGGVMFVDLETDKGSIQFAVYNEHNGAYGHEAFIIAEDFQHSVVI